MRTAIAGVGGLCLLAGWLVLAMLLADRLVDAHWAVRLLFYAVAGFGWALPARQLILWAARAR